ncbi:TetR/AcrR family transcriptional regulator [Rheinheimera nanhaiensis]|uniref:TetR family transcriptional regulator n=1 Tax=Rheinheimera nanhaiensis E407-8 TaxID=562729 RepID=I1DVI5_9GAMM|nr:TetR/AcrR family transcriptional regulator [Rheinheimera nanhaiensis]GAB58063.1 TetR family transcriptional regulator [Rheinheimera nanhaiensis E407-8]
MRDDILATALTLADHSSWEQLGLQQIAAALGISLADIYPHYRSKDELVDAWFDRADKAMLSALITPELPPASRIEQALSCWLSELSPYHKVTGQMLLYKLEPGHIHLQVAGVLRISRTVQWLREAARLQARGIARIGQEIALSSVFVAVFIYWLNDNSQAQQRSLALLKHKLQLGNRFGLWH